MSVKFKIGFTIDGETLFTMIAKMLPIEDLSVHEVPGARIQAPPKPKLISNHKPKIKRESKGLDLKRGINGIVLAAMTDKPMKAGELQPLVKAAGYSPNSVNSRLESLRIAGIIERIGDGRWRKKAAS